MKVFSFISVILHQRLLNPDQSLSLLQLLLAVLANQKQLLVQVVLEVWLQGERLGRCQSGSKWVSDQSLLIIVILD